MASQQHIALQASPNPYNATSYQQLLKVGLSHRQLQALFMDWRDARKRYHDVFSSRQWEALFNAEWPNVVATLLRGGFTRAQAKLLDSTEVV